MAAPDIIRHGDTETFPGGDGRRLVATFADGGRAHLAVGLSGRTVTVTVPAAEAIRLAEWIVTRYGGSQ